MIKLEPTERGFARGEFNDGNDVACSIQKSSSVARVSAFGEITEGNMLWLGCNEIGLTYFVSGRGWIKVSEEALKEMLGGENVLANTRMHLTQQNAAELWPLLKHFAETGELPE